MSFDDIFIDDDFEEDDNNLENEEDDDVKENDEPNKQTSPRSIISTFVYTGLHSCKVCDKCSEYVREPYL
ncbi:MAG: hypothetical protein QNJ36_17590 [Calothrix sp. MO_167.B42]|nr:hypothetical protein [Calothrix sp. MO_167.B42]